VCALVFSVAKVPDHGVELQCVGMGVLFWLKAVFALLLCLISIVRGRCE
jgi:hypothetical protein